MTRHSPTHVPRYRCWGPWLVDLSRDPRVIWNVRGTLKQGKELNRRLEEVRQENIEKPRLALTFDIERDQKRGMYEGSNSVTADRFLNSIAIEFSRNRLVGTFFVQGKMIESLMGPVDKLLANGNMIGLHGYDHELWGFNNWVTRQPPITVSERRHRLEMCLAVFEKCKLSAPTAFRAPNFTIDDDTFSLLREYGFLYDSSLASQKSDRMQPCWVAGVQEIPVSTAPVAEPYMNRRLGFYTSAHYRQFNFDVFMNRPLEDVKTDLRRLFHHQSLLGIPPHLVVYSHNWEYYKDSRDVVPELSSRVSELVSAFGMDVFRLDEITRGLSERARVGELYE